MTALLDLTHPTDASPPPTTTKKSTTMETKQQRKLIAYAILLSSCSDRDSSLILSASAFSSSRSLNPMRTLSSSTSASRWMNRHGNQWRRRHSHQSEFASLRMINTKRKRSATTSAAEGESPPPLSKPKKNNYYSPLPDFMQKDPTLITNKILQQRLLEQSASIQIIEEEAQRRENIEMTTMSIISLTLAVSVIYALASSTPMEVPEGASEQSENVIRELLKEGNVERLEMATRNVAMTVLPQSADDVIAVSIGEGIAGAIGAVATWFLGMVLKFREGGGELMSDMGGERMVSGALAEGDYFLTRAAAEPLFEAAGLPIFFASLASVLVANVPYQAIKLSSQKRLEQEKEKEKMLLDMLLEEEANREANLNFVNRFSNNVGDFLARLNVRAQMNDDDNFEVLEMEADMLEQQKKQQEQLKAATQLDYVELFADITKWLEYDVLINNYRGILTMPNGALVGPGLESAIFGLLSALSSQLYTDVLYIYSDFGNPAKREKTLNRSFEGWTSIYATKCLSAATLFGVYEAVRAPTARLCSQIVSGGVGGCVGSSDYDLCMETYLVDNPAGASLKAEFRAFVVSAINAVDNLSWILPLNDQETLENFVRGTAVSLYSVLVRFFSFG